MNKNSNSQFIIRNSSESGFTLIEMLMYILFITFFLGSSLGIAYNILSSSQDNRAKIAVEEEGNFLLKKISWVVNDADTISVASNILTVNKFDPPSGGNPIVVSSSGGFLNIQRGGNPVRPLNDDLFVVSSLSFSLISTGSINTDVFRASFYVNNKEFSLTRYVR